MSLLKPFNKLPELNAASILLVECEEEFQQGLAEILLEETKISVDVRLAKNLPLPMENSEMRPRIDLVVFIINLTSELSFKSAKASLKYLDPAYFLGKVCFMVTNARDASVPSERLSDVWTLAASQQCPLLFAEAETSEGVNVAAERLLTILKVSAGAVPTTTALYLSNLTRCTVPPEIDFDDFSIG